MHDRRTEYTTRSEARLGGAPLPWAVEKYSFGDAFVAQWRALAKVMQGEASGMATAEDAREFARLMEECYANQHTLSQPWMGASKADLLGDMTPDAV